MSLKRRNGKRVHVNLTITQEVAEKIDKYANDYGMSRSFAVENMCRTYLRDMELGIHAFEYIRRGGLDEKDGN